MIMNGDLVRIRKERVISYFKLPFQHLPSETEENINIPTVASIWTDTQNASLELQP
jgi:hypothetical protein